MADGASPAAANGNDIATDDAGESTQQVRTTREPDQADSPTPASPETRGNEIAEVRSPENVGDGAAAELKAAPVEELENGDGVKQIVSRTGKKLLVLDINGVLLDTYFSTVERPSNRKHDAIVGRFYVYRRPHCEEFLRFCFQNFTVGVWSSAKFHNVEKLVDYVFGDSKSELAFSWHQEHCTDTGFTALEKATKPLFLKELTKIWGSSRPAVPWERGDYGPWNTLLIDDSPHKVLRNPEHTAVLALSFSAMNDDPDEFLPTLQTYLEKLMLCDDVQLFVRDNPIGQPLITRSHSDWEFYREIVESKTIVARGHEASTRTWSREIVREPETRTRKWKRSRARRRTRVETSISEERRGESSSDSRSSSRRSSRMGRRSFSRRRGGYSSDSDDHELKRSNSTRKRGGYSSDSDGNLNKHELMKINSTRRKRSSDSEGEASRREYLCNEHRTEEVNRGFTTRRHDKTRWRHVEDQDQDEPIEAQRQQAQYDYTYGGSDDYLNKHNQLSHRLEITRNR